MDETAEMLTRRTSRNCNGGHKPISEHNAIQQLKHCAGDRSRFREWNEKLLNTFAQVHVGKNKALNTNQFSGRHGRRRITRAC